MKRLLLNLLLGLSVSQFVMSEEKDNLEKITLGGGCFWCVEAVFTRLDGVDSAVSGYMGGHKENPTYRQVTGKKTGHIEVVQVNYNPDVITTEKILEWFWQAHDPTTKDQQGNDKGPQYASAIFYENEEQKELAEASIKSAQKDFKNSIVTQLRKAEVFYPAEDYHQDYYDLNKNKDSYCRFVIEPKLDKLKLEN